MSYAWETTADDVRVVLERHDIEMSEDEIDDIFMQIDGNEIEQNVLCYDNFEDQCSEMFSTIEDCLMDDGIIKTKEKRFPSS